MEFLIIVPLLWHFGGSVDSSKGGSLASRGGENAAADPNVVLVMDHEKILQVDIEDVRLLKDFPHPPYHWIPIGPFCLFQFARNWESRSRRMSRDQIFYPRAKTGFRRDLGGGGNSGARGRRRDRHGEALGGTKDHSPAIMEGFGCGLMKSTMITVTVRTGRTRP